MSTARRIATLILLLAVAALGWCAYLAWQDRLPLPPRWNPLAPLGLAEEPGPLTRYKLSRLADAPPAACYAWLDAAGVKHQPLGDRSETDSCGWQGATRLSAFGSVRLASTAPLACPTVVALALWERHALQPAAIVQFGSPVTGIEHLGSYACRNIYGGAADRRSEHASANALDISAFRLANGRRITVLDPSRKREASPQAPEGLFLREAAQGACPFFSAVLGPGYNAAHRDHLHLDRGPYRVCS
ncbi:extensin [Xylophilus rhododendri]|uniref:Extensin n=1 Tax=Xylophilus rhododendri TaxID=2697032 RepID=A0A857J423_9BURK|nr:extensin family protein [Xylophilus rhododendri]QHI97879.1 extensin [Xylophilus rhododendri]